MRQLQELTRRGVLTFFPEDASTVKGQSTGSDHVFSSHLPVWGGISADLARPYDDPAQAPLFETLPSGTVVEEAAARTDLLVFAGADDSAQFRAACASRARVLVFEPSRARLTAFASQVADVLGSRPGIQCFGGDPASASPSLSEQLDHVYRACSYPVFFVRNGLEQAMPNWFLRLTNLLETLYYRRRIYKVHGQWLKRSLPVRDIRRELFWDQQVHWYANLPRFSRDGDVRDLKNRFVDGTAIIAASGPALDESLEYIRANRHRALLICVSRAARRLVEEGLTPDLVVVNDNRLDVQTQFEQLPRLEKSVLVCHALSCDGTGTDGRDRFGARYFFGHPQSQGLGRGTTLTAYGSVVTAAFSLAYRLGCSRCVLAGVQLGTPVNGRMAYSKGAGMDCDKAACTGDGAVSRRLVPAVNGLGDVLYTSPNFLDTSLWFTDLIRLSGVRTVNLTRASLVVGNGVEHDPDFDIPSGGDPAALMQDLLVPRAGMDEARIRRYRQGERERWMQRIRAAQIALSDMEVISAQTACRRGLEQLRAFDADGTTYVVEHHPAFDNQLFWLGCFGQKAAGDHARVYEARAQALRDYLQTVIRAGEELLRVLG